MLTFKKQSHSWWKRVSSFFSEHKYLFIAFLISAAVFHQWLTDGLFSYADGWFWYATNLREMLHPSVWTSTAVFGGLEQTLWRTPWNLLVGTPGLIGWDYGLSSKIFMLIPTIVLPIWSSYLLVKYIFNNKRAAFVGSLLFSFNTYFLAIITQGQVLLPLSFSFGVFSFYFIVRQYDTPRPLYLAAAIALSFVCGFTDFRGFYLTFCLILAYTIFFIINRRQHVLSLLRDFGLFILGLGILNLYWILPAFTARGAMTNGILARPLFAPQFWTLADALSLHQPFWNGANTTWFVPVMASWYFWILPALAILAIILWPKNRYIIFFSIIAVVGVFLSKETNAPLGELYQWAFTHIPGFSAFRESTKFYFFTALAYAVLISGLVHRLSNIKIRHKIYTHIAKMGSYATLGIIVLMTAIIIFPYVTNQMTSFTQPRTISSDYTALNTFLENQPDYFRTLWLPTASRWGLNTVTHPAVNMADVLSAPIQGLDAQYADSLTGVSMIDSIKSNRLANILDSASIKYVIVPLDNPNNSDDFFHYYKTSRNDYLAKLDAIHQLKRIDSRAGSLAVYENASYRSHISVSDMPYIASDPQNIGEEYAFLKQIDASNPVFVTSNLGITGAGTTQTVFTNPKLIKDGSKIYLEDTFHVPSSQNELFYKNTAARDIGYTSSSNKVTVNELPFGNPLINNVSPPQTGVATTLGTAPLHTGTTYMIFDGTATLIQPNTTVDFGASGLYKSAGIYEADKNLIDNSSFESGPWEPTVGDCDDYDKNPQIAQSIVSDNPAADQHRALQLVATRHAACTNTTFTVTPGMKALFNIDYKGIDKTQAAGFHIQFNDSKNTMVDERIVIGSDEWTHILRYIAVPDGATKASLYLYAYESDETTSNTVRYANIAFNSTHLVSPITLPSTKAAYTSTRVSLAPGDAAVRYDMTNYKSHNLITDPSFEHGPWQSTVGDCANYDAHPDISQSIVPGNPATGGRALQLSAAHHTACTYSSFTPETRGTHLLNFDYQSPSSSKAGYYIVFNDASQTAFTDQLPSQGTGWQHFEKQLSIPAGATSGTLYLYAYESDGVKSNVVRYDNVALQKIPQLANQFYLDSPPTASLKVPTGVYYKTVSQSEYVVDVNNAKGSFFLNLGENYDNGWKLAIVPESVVATCNSALNKADAKSTARECGNVSLNNQYTGISLIKMGEGISNNAANHVETNGFTNSWMVNPGIIKSQYAGNYIVNPDNSLSFKLILYYQPGPYFDIGAALSTLGGIIGFIITIALVKRYRRFPITHHYRHTRQ